MSVAIDIWSDVACPWCYIGKRRLETALNQFQGETSIEYHSFELSPDTPTDFAGTEVDFLVEHKGMPAHEVEQMLTQVSEIAAAEGLNYNFDALQHTNTRKAHELLHLAKAEGKQGVLKERLLSAYFTQGRHLGQVAELVALAQEVGIDGARARAALESGEFDAAVTEDIARARQLGIRGVPFFVFNRKYGVSGAQSPDVFLDVVQQAAQEDAPLP